MLSRFFIWLSGHSPVVASQVQPAEQLRISALGMTLFLPVSIGAIGGFATAWRITEGNLLGAIVAGIVVGLFTLVVDRSLIASGNRGLPSLTLRVVLTLLTSTVFAHTALLWLFTDRIDAEASKTRQTELQNIASLFRPDYDRTSFRINGINGQIEALNAELQRVGSELSKTSSELRKYREVYADEVAGRGPSGKPGEGSESRRIMIVHIRPLEADLARYQGERDQLSVELGVARKDLQAAFKALESAPDKAIALEQYGKLTQEALNRRYSGVLTQFVLLHEIISEDQTALLAYVFVSLLLLFWELVPVMLKFTMETREYDARVRVEIESVKTTLETRAEMASDHALRMEMMELEQIEAAAWVTQAEERFKLVDEKRQGIPKRANPEHRDAYLLALKVLIDSLGRTGNKLGVAE